MVALLCFLLTLLASPFKSKTRLEAENAVLGRQLIILRRKVRGRVHLHERGSLVFGPAVSMVSIGAEAFIIVRLARRDLAWVNVTRHPTADYHGPGIDCEQWASATNLSLQARLGRTASP